MDDRYGDDVLATGWRERTARRLPEVEVSVGLVLELADGGYVGEVTRVSGRELELEDRHGRRRLFPLDAGFLLEGELVRVTPAPVRPAVPARRRTASGSFALDDTRARVARASRILVEGRHDAELVERVWGDDLRAEGVVVEYLQGVDLLDAALRDDPPSPERRYGVLVDHLVPGSKESRLAQQVSAGPHGAHVLIVGHPFVDVWQCVTPRALGISAWPEVPRDVDWKTGVCRALGWPAASPTDLARAWQRVLGAVSSYRDLEPALLGRVEQLIDFVTAS
ncbi:MAG: DUF3097 family protein [Microbacterium sp.]|uniref:DUF3097 family protein n=1 Tax=Microbacterium sp. TaxID=51671 RepID=UPI003A886816